MDQDCDERLDDLVGVLGFADADFSKYFHLSFPLGLPAIRAGAVVFQGAVTNPLKAQF